MTFDCYSMFWALLLGGGIGLLTGFFGAGGGFILTPALNIFLGLDMSMAVGTSALQVSGASALTLAQRVDRRWLGARVAMATAVGIFPGAWLGTWMVNKLQAMGDLTLPGGRVVPAADSVLLFLFLILLSGIGMGMYWELRQNREEKPDRAGLLHVCQIPPLCNFRTIPAGPFSLPVLALLGLGMGILSGLLGIGGGVVMLPVLFYLVGQQTEYATLTTTMIVLLSGCGSAFFHGLHGNIAWPLIPPLLAGSVGGTFAGVRFQKRAGGRKVRQYFIWVITAALLLVGWKLFKLTIA